MWTEQTGRAQGSSPAPRAHRSGGLPRSATGCTRRDDSRERRTHPSGPRKSPVARPRSQQGLTSPAAAGECASPNWAAAEKRPTARHLGAFARPDAVELAIEWATPRARPPPSPDDRFREERTPWSADADHPLRVNPIVRAHARGGSERGQREPFSQSASPRLPSATATEGSSGPLAPMTRPALVGRPRQGRRPTHDGSGRSYDMPSAAASHRRVVGVSLRSAVEAHAEVRRASAIQAGQRLNGREPTVVATCRPRCQLPMALRSLFRSPPPQIPWFERRSGRSLPVSKTGSGGSVRRGFESLPLR